MRQDMHPVYLDHAAMGLPSAATLAAGSKFMDCLASPDLTGTDRSLILFEAVDRARNQAASLVNVDPENVLLVDNTSHGLGLVTSSLPLSEGDNVLVGDLEFLSAAVSWRSVSRRLGVEIRSVKTAGGQILPEDFARAADSRTRVIVVSSVQEVTGFRCDLRAFGHLAQKLNAVLVVDGIQEAGALHVDLEETPVDVYCAGGSKWLRSPFGLGFLYVSPDLLSRLSPPTFGYLALKEPDLGWQAYLQSPERTAFDPLQELQNASKLSTGGMPNGIGAVALEQAIREVREIGTPVTSRRISHLRTSLITQLTDCGTDICSARDLPGQSSGIVCFGSKMGFNEGKKLWTALLKAKIQVSFRYTTGIGGIRVSLHHDNTDRDIQELMRVLHHEWLRSDAGCSRQAKC